MKTLEANIHRELQPGSYTTQQQQQEEDDHDKDAVRQLVMEEVLQVRQLWQAHWDLLTETVQVLHLALDSYSHATAEQHQEDKVLLLSYYQWRASHQPRNGGHPRWKTSADQELDQRDINDKVGPGHFWGAHGEYIRYAYYRQNIAVIHSYNKTKRCSSFPFFAAGYTGNCHRGLAPHHDQEDVVEIEDIASLEEARNYRHFPIRRGLGWNSHHHWDDDDDDMLVAAIKGEASLNNNVVVRRTEQEDQSLLQREYLGEQQRIVLILCKEEDETTPPYMSPPKRLTGFVQPRPKEMATEKEEKEEPPPLAKEKKRAPRKCQRCLQFGGTHATQCAGSKARFGRKHCEYFSATGKSK
jgi:hypothetical protein